MSILPVPQWSCPDEEHISDSIESDVNDAAAAAAVAAALPAVDEEDAVRSVTSGAATCAPAAAAASRYDVLTDLARPFGEALTLWLARQGAEVILKEETYTTICQTLKARDTAHARYRKWAAKYELVDLGGGSPLYLQVRIDAAKTAKPRGRSGHKRKADEVISSTLTISSNSSQTASTPAAATNPIWKVKRVPRPNELENIITMAHGTGMEGTGHGGVTATYKKIEAAWVSIPRSLVEAYVKRCHICALQQPSKSSMYTIIAIRSNHFWHRVQMDEFTLKRVVGGVEVEHLVLHLYDHFSKFSLLYVVPDKTANSVATVLLQVFSQFGPPEILQSDNGKEFINQQVVALCAEWKIQFVHGAPYKPQTQGGVERGNGVCKEKLRASIEESPQRSFNEHLLYVQWQMNTTYRVSIKTTPYQLAFNRAPILPLPSAFNQQPTVDQLIEPSAEVIVQRNEQQQSDAAAAASSSIEYQDKFVATYNGKVGVRSAFQAGDLVALRLHNPRSHRGIAPASLALPRLPCVILLKTKAGKFVLYTRYGILIEHIGSNDLEIMPEVHRPPPLQIDHKAVYEDHKSCIKPCKRISMLQLIAKQTGTEPPTSFDPKTMKLRISKRCIQ